MQDNVPLFVRFPQLKKIFFGDNIGRSTIDRWEREKGFPRRIKVGANSVVWDSQLVRKWFEDRANKE
jgi:predicted DNA-binding transcriptional regulator AlpA